MLRALRGLAPAAGVVASFHVHQYRLDRVGCWTTWTGHPFHSALVHCGPLTPAILPLGDPVIANVEPALLEIPGPCRAAGRKRTADEAVGDADVEIVSVRPPRRLRGKQKADVSLDTPLSSITAGVELPVPSQGQGDDFDTLLSDIGGSQQVPLDPVEPSDEQLQVI